MKLFNDIRNLINEDSFKIIIYDNYIDIINYSKIINISDNLLTIKSNKKILIYGKDLKINKLLDDELLIMGKVDKIIYE